MCSLSMLLCLSMARMMFSPSISEGSGNGGLAAAGCGQDREGPLRVEGKLLEGHAGQRVKVWAGRGRQIDRRPAPGCGGRTEGQAAPGVGGYQSAEWRE